MLASKGLQVQGTVDSKKEEENISKQKPVQVQRAQWQTRRLYSLENNSSPTAQCPHNLFLFDLSPHLVINMLTFYVELISVSFAPDMTSSLLHAAYSKQLKGTIGAATMHQKPWFHQMRHRILIRTT